MNGPEFSVVVPVYNEGENIGPLLRGLDAQVHGDYEILICYDFAGDSTLPAIAALSPPVPRVRLVKNDFGKGVVNAIRAGFAASRGWLGVVVTMADLSDPPEKINAMVQAMRAGADVVAGSRYMPGGSQTGGPFLKRTLSRLAGKLAFWLTGIGIRDVTTNFRGYSRRLIDTVPIESQGGFELGLELTAKCHVRGWPVAEVPSSWQDRSAGQSRFRLFKWLPGYLRWYMLLLTSDPFGLPPRLKRLRRQGPHQEDYRYFGVYDLPGYGWVVRRFKRANMVIAVNTDGKIVFVRQHRPFNASGESHWELPGGATETAETVIESSRRELLEETGFEAGDAGKLLASGLEAVPGMGTYPHDIVMFTGCRKVGEAKGDAGERITEAGAFTKAEIEIMIRENQIVAVPTLGGLALYFGLGSSN